LAIAVIPVSERDVIIKTVENLILSIDPADRSPPGTVYVDQGMKKQDFMLPEGWSAQLGCDSRLVAGIQIADCAAHIVSMILLSELGLISKSIKTEDGFPENEVEIAWELWSSIRYSLSSGRPVGGYDDEGWCEPTMVPFGLLVSEGCSEIVRAAIEQRFGTVWVGCIH
jgi:hypothetical protein